MRTIINDRRYQALRTLAERKATFREYIEEYKIRDRVREDVDFVSHVTFH